MINWVSKVRNDEEIIKKEVIQKLFLSTEIAQKSDSIDDDYFIWPEEIEYEIIMENSDEYQKNDDSS